MAWAQTADTDCDWLKQPKTFHGCFSVLVLAEIKLLLLLYLSFITIVRIASLS